MKINSDFLREIIKYKEVSDERGGRIANTISNSLLGIRADNPNWLYVTEYELAKLLSISDSELQELFYKVGLKCTDYKSVKDYNKSYHEYIVTSEDHDGKFTSVVWSTRVIRLFAEVV